MSTKTTTAPVNRRERRALATKPSNVEPTENVEKPTSSTAPNKPNNVDTNVNVNVNKPKEVEVIGRREETKTALESKSALIRRLHFKDGMTIGAIAKATKIRYQMVRNVVKAEETKIILTGITDAN